MPAFKDAFTAEPDTIWHLAHYVLHLADERRHGKQFEPGSARDAPAAATPSEPATSAAEPPQEPSP